MNVILFLYYCCCSLGHNYRDLNTNNYSGNFLSENSYSSADDQPLDLSFKNVPKGDFFNIHNCQTLVNSNILNETNNDFADSIPNKCDEIEVHFENNSGQCKNITHYHQNLNLLNEEDLKNIDNRISLEDQQNSVKKNLTDSEILEISFSEKIESNENNELKRKFQKAGFHILKNDQRFLKRDNKKQKCLTDEPVTEQNTYDKNVNLSTYNTASTSADYFHKLQIDGIKSFQSDLKAKRTDVEKPNSDSKIKYNITASDTTKLNLHKYLMNKQIKQNKVEVTFKTIENGDTIYINDEFNDLFDKINSMGSTYGDHAYTIFEENFNIIQQDLLLTLRNAFEFINEENGFINEQIRKLESAKRKINMITRIRDTIHICQELLTFKIKKFNRKFDQDMDKYPLIAKLKKHTLAGINRPQNLHVGFRNRSYRLVNSLKKHKHCNTRSCFMEIVHIIKRTTYKDLKFIFLAGMNSLFDKNNSDLDIKNRKTLVLFYLREHENKRFNIDWEEFLFKTLFFKGRTNEFNKDIWFLIKCYDSDIAYQGYIYMNYGPFHVSNFLLGNSDENITFNQSTKLLIELVTIIKCRLYDIPY